MDYLRKKRPAAWQSEKTARAALILIVLSIGLAAFFYEPVYGEERVDSPITIQYTRDDAGWAKLASTAAQKTLQKLETEFGLKPGPPILIIIAASDDDFQRKQPRGPVQTWAAGTAWPEQNLIILKSPRYAENLKLGRLLNHELAHLVLERMFVGHRVPRWLNEGLTMHLSGDWGWGRQVAMFRALMTDRLISLERLSGEFPINRIDAETAYAESYYFIAFLKDRFGPEAFARLIRYLGMNISYRHAFLHTTGQVPEVLEDAFIEWLRSRFSIAWVITSPGMLWPLAALFMILAVFFKRRASRKKLAQWEEEAGEDETGEDETGEANADEDDEYEERDAFGVKDRWIH